MYPYLASKEMHAKRFADILGEEIGKIRNGELDAHLELQKQVYTPRWSWDQRIDEWTSFLSTLTQNEQSTSEPMLETSQSSSVTDIQHVGL
jgi:hypothetical protein